MNRQQAGHREEGREGGRESEKKGQCVTVSTPIDRTTRSSWGRVSSRSGQRSSGAAVELQEVVPAGSVGVQRLVQEVLADTQRRRVSDYDVSDSSKPALSLSLSDLFIFILGCNSLLCGIKHRFLPFDSNLFGMS